MNKAILLLLLLQQLTLQPPRSKGAGRRKRIKRLRSLISHRHLLRFDHMLLYERMAVIATLSPSNSCGSCRTKLPSARASIVRRHPDRVHTCPLCGCFLYAPPADWEPFGAEQLRAELQALPAKLNK